MAPPARPAFPECAPGPWEPSPHGTPAIVSASGQLILGVLVTWTADAYAVRDFILACVNAAVSAAAPPVAGAVEIPDLNGWERADFLKSYMQQRGLPITQPLSGGDGWDAALTYARTHARVAGPTVLLELSEDDAQALANYRHGVETGVMTQATPNVVRHLIEMIDTLSVLNTQAGPTVPPREGEAGR